MKNKILAFLTAIAVTLGFAGASAYAAPPTIPADPTGGAMGDIQSSTQTWVLTYGAPVLFGLLILGVIIKLGQRWGKKAGNTV